MSEIKLFAGWPDPASEVEYSNFAEFTTNKLMNVPVVVFPNSGNDEIITVPVEITGTFDTAGTTTVTLYFTTDDVGGLNARLGVRYISTAVLEDLDPTGYAETVLVTQACPGTGEEFELKSAVFTLDSSLIAGNDLTDLQIYRLSGDAADTLAGNLLLRHAKIVHGDS